MKKNEIIEELKKLNIPFDEKESYQTLLKRYKDEVKIEDMFENENSDDFFGEITYSDIEKEKIIKQLSEYEVVDETKTIEELKSRLEEVIENENNPILQAPDQKDIEERQYINGDDRRNKLIRSIIEYMPQILGRRNVQQHEIQKMFNLYNAFYLRNDSPGCGKCVSRVFEALKNIYIQYK